MLWKIVADRPAQTVAAAVGPCAPREIEIRLRSLIRDYLHQRSTAVAVAVARHIEALSAHPDYRGSWEERCALRRLAWHWNSLAWLAADQPAPPFGEAVNRDTCRASLLWHSPKPQGVVHESRRSLLHHRNG